MNKISKCKRCGNYELRLKLFENKQCENNFPELGLCLCRGAEWKWCKLKNNWCRNVAGRCDFVSVNTGIK